ncbi:UPF0426 protein At1g28150, chloroplastic isoform X1 [Fagus crenata]
MSVSLVNSCSSASSSSSSCALWKIKKNPLTSWKGSLGFGHYDRNRNMIYKNGVIACFFNPTDDPILKQALKEPVSFMGGVFAGLLRLDLNEEPLKEWVTRTAEASGIAEEEIDAERSKPDEVPQQIEIE